MSLAVLLLLACGRPVTDVPVHMVGVGSDPDEIGPAPTPYGGVVEYDHVELAGGGLSLGHMGLGSFSEVGPGMIGFAPPYSGVIGFSYLFDQKLPAASTLTFGAPVPPSTEDSCYTAYDPEGPIGSFTTLDVGDWMEFAGEDGSGFRMSRVPADYPPDPRDLFIYYSSVEEYAPYARTHLVPDPSDPSNPAKMVPEVWHKANFPFGATMTFRFPGGLSRFDQPVGSIPRPSSSVETPPQITLPEELGGVLLSWDGPRYDHDLADAGDGPHKQCLEFYGDGRAAEPATPEDCNTPPAYPTSSSEYDSFPGQIYTAPWDASDGKLTLEWTPGTADGRVSFAVRFMAPIDPNDGNFLVPGVKVGDEVRTAEACEEDASNPNFTWQPDPELFDLDDNGTPIPKLSVQGDPFSHMVEVSCLLKDDGEFTLDRSAFQDALDYVAAQPGGAGGVVFFFSRSTEAEATLPAAKDQYDQRHDISPIRIVANDTKVGRFAWNVVAADGGGQ